ncbi:RNA polymerase I enhancer binding protein [Ceratobasidium sp. 370]|nr:RNA polymerase I enhancer binding protein [Ceratobasidium sp. 370]
MIFDYLEPLTSSEDESLRALSREARLVLISRRSLSDSLPPATDARRSDLETYQEALRLIQDPILPVRAHGLHMLRQLVVPPKAPKGTSTVPPPELDPALIPGILDVFLQSVQEEDSFVFLNAVQGLSAMVDRLGREILQSLLRIYAGGIESGRQMERAELDKRVRVGEALVQVVRRYGDALGLYALSILAQCVETSPAALTSWADDILSGMIDILQIESVRATSLTRAAREEARSSTEKAVIDKEIDARPQEVDSKLPPLRRSALLCFAQVVRSMIVGVYDGSNPVQRGALWNRARTLLDYLRITESDPVVRVQATETLALVKQLGRAELGLEFPEVLALAPPKQLWISLAAMTTAACAPPPRGAKKKKSKKHLSEDVSTIGHPPMNTTEDGGISQAIQNALSHVRASEAIATSSNGLATSHGEQPATKAKKRSNADSAGPTVEPDATQPKTKKKKKKQHDTSVASASPALAPSASGPSNVPDTPDMSRLAPAYIPHASHHIPIDPALTQNDQLVQPPHPHPSSNSPFTMDTGAAALQHQDNPNTDPYMFNQDNDMSMLGSNEDILRALQGFDISKFAALASENPESVHPDPGDPNPSAAGNTPQSSRSRAKRTVAPQPTEQAVNPEHADILATHWLNPAKLADLVKSQGLVYKKGKFSAIEEHQIEEALQNYAKGRNLTPTEIDGIIFSKGKKAKEEYSTFWSEITRAVPQRPIIAVYHHVRRTHHPMKQQGKWTPEEDAIVIAAVAELGQKWEQISERVGRMSSDCRDRYRNHLVDQDARVTGPWTKEEEDELTKIVLELTVQRGLQADNDVLWSEVSERMGGRRTRQQVRIKWTDALNKRVKNSGERPRWNAQDAYILVHKVASMPVQDDTEIDWKLLPDPQWNLWSAHQLQRRWFGLKKTLKDADTMPHSEIIAILQSKFSEPPEQPNAPRRYETKKSRTNAISREFINDEEAGFEDFTNPNGLFPQTSDGSSIDPELVRETQEQLEAVLEIATRQAAASGSGTHG